VHRKLTGQWIRLPYEKTWVKLSVAIRDRSNQHNHTVLNKVLFHETAKLFQDVARQHTFGPTASPSKCPCEIANSKCTKRWQRTLLRFFNFSTKHSGWLISEFVVRSIVYWNIQVTDKRIWNLQCNENTISSSFVQIKNNVHSPSPSFLKASLLSPDEFSSFCLPLKAVQTTFWKCMDRLQTFENSSILLHSSSSTTVHQIFGYNKVSIKSV
jgi:hypothetical protein